MAKLEKFFSICKPEKYTNKEGKEKTKWYKIGTLRVYDNGRQFVKIYILNEDFVCFEDKKKK